MEQRWFNSELVATAFEQSGHPLTRRKFNEQLAASIIVLRVAMAAELGGAVFILEGCGLVGDIETWVPVGIATMKSIELVLQSNGFPLSAAEQTIFNDVIAALNALTAAAQAYGATTPPPATAIQKLQAAFNAVTAQMATFFQAIALPEGNVLSLIVGLANIIIGAIMGFQNKIPTPPAGANVFTMATKYQVASTSFSVKPKVYNHPRSFKSDYNHMLDTWERTGVTVPKEARFGWFETHF